MKIDLLFVSFLGSMKLFLYYFFKKFTNKKLVFLFSFFLILILSLRSFYFGPDTIGYVNNYDLLEHKDFLFYWTSFLKNASKDPFYYLVAKIFNLLGFSSRIWLITLSTFFVFSVAKVINRHSPEPFISFVALLSLGYVFFSITAIRQTIALSFLLLSYNYLYDLKIVKFTLMVIIGSLFHTSALFFLLAYPLMFLKKDYLKILIIAVAFFISFSFPDLVRLIILNIGWTDALISYSIRNESITASGFIIHSFILGFCLLFKNNVLSKNKKNIIFYNMLFIGLLFQAFAVVVAEFFRLAIYFNIFSIVFVPIVIFEIKDKKTKLLTYFIILISFIAYLIWTNSFNKYSFMWN